ncbi:MAG: SDR family oxidoreductase [Chloroflexi bacterium]|nr:SDR family oxidoreductase [Chloroflexota bacterium]
MLNTKDPAVLITGASTGIGFACALDLAQRGWRVYAGVRGKADAERLEAAHANISALALDVTKPKQIRSAIKHISSLRGSAGLQGLVNNAGVGMPGPLEFLEMDDLRRQFEVNFFGQVAVTQAALPLLRAGRGRVVNMSSIGGRVAAPFLGPYSASKFALEAFTDSLRRELLPWNLHVASIQAGTIATPIWQKSLAWVDEARKRYPARANALYGHAMQRSYQRVQGSGQRGLPPETVARVVWHALSARRPRTRYIVGRGTRSAIWLAKLLPDEVLDWVINRNLYR